MGSNTQWFEDPSLEVHENSQGRHFVRCPMCSMARIVPRSKEQAKDEPITEPKEDWL